MRFYLWSAWWWSVQPPAMNDFVSEVHSGYFLDAMMMFMCRAELYDLIPPETPALQPLTKAPKM